jgi:hypothetical protein
MKPTCKGKCLDEGFMRPIKIKLYTDEIYK